MSEKCSRRMTSGILPQFSGTICSMFKRRVEQLKEKIKNEKLDAVLVSSVSNISYLSGFTNFSKDEREAYIFLGKNFQYIITDGRYSEAVEKQISHLELFERGNEKSTEELFKKHKKEIKTLGIEEDNLTVAEFKTVKKHFKNIKHFNVSHFRSAKTDDEIKRIKKACQIGDLAFKYILKKIKVGVTEKEIAGELKKFIKENGAEFSFPAIVAFGKNSSIPHHQTGNTKLKDGDTVLLDLGAKVENYCSDMTRTVFFGSPINKQSLRSVDLKQRKIYRVVLEAQQKAVDFINRTTKGSKEIKAQEVDRVAREYIRSQGFPDIPHSLGHGVGLEVHEHPSLSPKSRDILKEGMVFSIEPGIYLPNFGGVRIEDLFVLEKNGLRQLTNSDKKLFFI